MQTSDYILTGIGVLIAFLGYVGKRVYEGIQADMKEIRDKQQAQEVTQAKIIGMIDGCKIGIDRTAEDVKEIKEML